MQEIIFGLIFVFILYLFVRFFTGQIKVEGPSMETTLFDGNGVIIEKISKRLFMLKRFEVIVFQSEDGQKQYIKRIIGLPGETIKICEQSILINGQPLKDNYCKSKMSTAGIASESIQIPDNEYFVLGDNRMVSEDSRYEWVGFIKKSNIIGRVIYSKLS